MNFLRVTLLASVGLGWAPFFFSNVRWSQKGEELESQRA